MASGATKSTIEVQEEFLQTLPFMEGQTALEQTRRGLMVETPDLVIRDDSGKTVWDAAAYYALFNRGEQRPDTVNPSLWRHQKLECVCGLFEVTDGIWQVRGYDVSNLTIIRSQNGYILVDLLHSPYTARAALELAFSHLPKRPITGLIITHSHGDHFGGAYGGLAVEGLRACSIPLIAPKDFTHNTIIEYVSVGRAMMRRGSYQFGGKLSEGAEGSVGTGLGIGITKRARGGLVVPSKEITFTGEEMNLDGIDFVFQLTPDSEAPAELCFYLPQFRTLCMSELVNQMLHNILPMRGAQVRSAKKWADYIMEALILFGDKAEAVITGHGWPVWGTENIRHYLKTQRDLYKFINDQTVRHINHGKTMPEIAEALNLPPALDREWCNRNYYGHIKHNIKATYQFYLGFYDGNPAHLDELAPEEAGRRYVEFMGGVEETLRKAKKSYADGDYRWAATVLNHLVFGFPENMEARDLLAQVYEQLAWQCECAAWRNAYLTGALELRNGPGPEDHTLKISQHTFANMDTGYLLDYLAATLDPARALGKNILIHLYLEDREEEWSVILENCVLNYWPAKLPAGQAEYVLTRETLDKLACRVLDVNQAMEQGLIKTSGHEEKLAEIFACFEDIPNFNFGIVTP